MTRSRILAALVAVLACAWTPAPPTLPLPGAVAELAHAVPAAARPALRDTAPAPLAPAAAQPAPVPSPVVPPLVALQYRYALTGENDVLLAQPKLNATSGILFDLDTHRVLWARAPHAPLPPASTTKLLTSMVALRNFPLSMEITATPDALNQEKGVETRLGLIPGEVMTAGELVKSMVMVSANDAAQVLANDTVGPDAFVAAMNAQVAALGLHDSHFVTPVGLDAPRQLASAYDLGVIGAVDYLQYPFIRQSAATLRDDMPASAHHRDYPLPNIDYLLRIYPPALGLKPGFTDDAGPCLVALAARGNHRLVGVLMHAPLMYPQMRRLMEWGYAQEGLGPYPNLPVVPG